MGSRYQAWYRGLCTLIQLISLGLQALFSSPSKALCMVSFATNELKKQEETNKTLWQYQKTIKRANLPSGILFYLSIIYFLMKGQAIILDPLDFALNSWYYR